MENTQTEQSKPIDVNHPHIFQLDWGVFTIFEMLSHYQFNNVLDIGSGMGEHTRLFRHFGKEVFSVDLNNKEADYVGDFLELEFDRKFDAIWCSHVIEHQRNVGLFLDKLFSLVEEGGVIAISLPIHPAARLISGHISHWNTGLLCYNIIAAGYDCSEARIINTFELSCVLTKKTISDNISSVCPTAGMAADIEHAVDDYDKYFPFPAFQGGNALIQEVNWIHDYKFPKTEDMRDITIRSKNIGEFTIKSPEFSMRTNIES